MPVCVMHLCLRCTHLRLLWKLVTVVLAVMQQHHFLIRSLPSYILILAFETNFIVMPMQNRYKSHDVVILRNSWKVSALVITDSQADRAWHSGMLIKSSRVQGVQTTVIVQLLVRLVPVKLECSKHWRQTNLAISMFKVQMWLNKYNEKHPKP